MTPTRRDTLKLGAGALLSASLPWPSEAGASDSIFAPKPGKWRSFELTTTVEVTAPAGPTQIWIPVPGFAADDWMKPGDTTWRTASGAAALLRDSRADAALVHAKWPAGTQASIVVTSRFSTRDRAVALSEKRDPVQLTPEQRRRYTAPTSLKPLDGIVRETAEKIVSGSTSELEKARRIYEWIVDNTFRDPKTRGCGTGDIASMLKTGNLSGKCADLNALYVGLARAAGLPARDLYGLRVAPSAFGYKSLGANSPVVTKAQHCRAEVFLTGIGWLPVDPADVRKVVLEEPPGRLALTDAKVAAARASLFGSWETNWVAFNDGEDVALPGLMGTPEPFLMYPQGQTADGRLDPLDPDAFKYTIGVREIAT
ncbi:MAG: transglutaminase-like domain-containing protein [Hyphomicrobiaceae bacterium]